MNKTLTTLIGVVLATAAVSASAGKQDAEVLAQCKGAVESYYGDDTRTRLRSIRRSGGATLMRLQVKPQNGKNTAIVCSVGKDGVSNLSNSDGVALNAAAAAEQKVSLAD
ncbi:MAG: hypothetical protein ACI87W_002983 [Halieaceae bacterium]|jgi:hypothetical protein